MIRSQSLTLSSGNVLSDTILIDSSLGRSLQFIFDYAGTSIEPSVTSPRGFVYEASNMDVVTHDTEFGVYRFTIPMAEVGPVSLLSAVTCASCICAIVISMMLCCYCKYICKYIYIYL